MDIEGDVVEHGAIAEFSNKAINLDHRFAVSLHAAKKKLPVSTAFMPNIGGKVCTTAVVVDCPTPSAPPSTFSPALHEIVMMSQAKTTLLIIPEYRSQGSALSSARKM